MTLVLKMEKKEELQRELSSERDPHPDPLPVPRRQTNKTMDRTRTKKEEEAEDSRQWCCFEEKARGKKIQIPSTKASRADAAGEEWMDF